MGWQVRGADPTARDILKTRTPGKGVFGVGAILHTRDGRYLMQLRDDQRSVSMHGLWGLFGGIVEDGESPARALLRELDEELSFRPRAAPAAFSRVGWDLGFARRGFHAKSLYALPITTRIMSRMRQREGQAMRLFSLSELLATENVVPWDAFAVTLFERRRMVRARSRDPRG